MGHTRRGLTRFGALIGQKTAKEGRYQASRGPLARLASLAMATVLQTSDPASRGTRIKGFVALTKPRIIELLLVETVPAMIVAKRGWPGLWLIIATVIGGTLAAGGANAVNMYVDRDIDAIMDRTKGRPLVTGVVQPTEALVFAFAGIFGLNGLNANSLGITCNTLAQLNYATDGLPVSFIVRSILERHNMEEAEQFLRTIKHASGQNYILSSPRDMRCFECCGTSIVQYLPETTPGRVFHSNHPLVNQDENDLLPPDKRRNKSTVARLDSIGNRLGDMTRKMTLEDIKSALAAHDDPGNPVSRKINPTNVDNSMGYTAGSSIYELGSKPRLHFAAGPPCETAFEIFEFNTTSSLDMNQLIIK